MMINMIPIILPLFQTTNMILTPNTINSITSFTTLYQTTNNVVNGFEGIAVSLILFMVLLGAASFKMKLIDAATAASALCLMLSVMVQQLGIIVNIVPVIWLGATILFGLISLMSGWEKPYD